MKNLLLLFALVLGFLPLAQAQEFSLGPVIGVNYASLTNAPSDARGLVGLNAGLALVYSTEEHWGIGVDLKYSGEGMVVEQRGITAKTRLDYVRVPLKFYYFFNKFGDDFRPKIYVGPSFGVLVGGKTERFTDVGTIKTNSTDLYEQFDVGALFGTGFNYRIAQGAWLNVDVAYAHGLTNIAPSGKAFNRNLMASIGIAWGLN